MCLAMHPDGSVAATGEAGKNPKIVVWDTTTMQTVATIKGFHKRAVKHLAFSPNGKELVSVGCDPDTPIPIVDVQVDVFRMLLRYVYGGDIPTKNIIKDQAKAIINAANRFECTGLKLTAEAELATTGITTENAAELILFADATNCAMLKENSMDFFVNNTQEVMASEGFAQVKESPSVMAELMDVALGGSKKRPASSIVDDERDYKRMRVATLWQKLDGKGLAVDGAKDILISRLEEADTKARAQAEALAQNGAENEDESEDEDE